jgi:hypothetical protein
VTPLERGLVPFHEYDFERMMDELKEGIIAEKQFLQQNPGR